MKKLIALLVALLFVFSSFAFASPDIEPGEPFDCSLLNYHFVYEGLLKSMSGSSTAQGNANIDITWSELQQPDMSYGYPIHTATALDGVLTMRAHCLDGTNMDMLELTVEFTQMNAEQIKAVSQHLNIMLPVMFMSVSVAENNELTNEDIQALYSELPVMVQPINALVGASDENAHGIFEVSGKALGYPYYAFAQLDGDRISGTIVYDITFMSKSSSIEIN